MDLYNTQTRQVDPIDDEDALNAALLAGTHSFKAGSMVPAVAPDGTVGSIPAENVAEAIRTGYKVETPTQRTVRDYVEENRGLPGALKVAGRSFVNQLGMGIPDLILNKTQDPLDVAKYEALKKERDLANLAGGVPGFAGSLLFGAPLFKGASAVGEGISSAIANKLAVEAGEQVGSRTIGEAAKGIGKAILAKGLGGAAEGGIIAAPHAITEASLGDPDDAAETILSNMALGGLLGGGGVVGKEIFKLGKEGGAKAAEMITRQKETAENLARRVAKVATGVDEDDVLHYVENMDRVNAAPDKSLIMDNIDTAVGSKKAEVDVAKQLVQDSKKELDDGYQAARFDLSRTRAPEHVADDLLGALENEKSVLGDLSNKADEALARSDATYQTKDFTKLLDGLESSLRVGKSKAIIGDEALAASGKINALKERISQLEPEINGETARDLLRQVRSDINYNQAAGEFNDTVNKLKKKFTQNISGVLKGTVPEYESIMNEMSERSKVLEQMSKAAGTKDKAIGFLNKTASLAGKTKNDLLDQFSTLTGKDWGADLAEYKKAQDLLEQSKRGDIKKELLPGLYDKHEMAKQALEKVQSEFEPISRLTEGRTQSVIRNQGFKNYSEKDRRALQALGEMTGQDFLNNIKDRNVLDSFMKERTQGSRRTNLFGIIGGSLGGLVGGPIGVGIGSTLGGAAGATLDNYGGRVLKQIMDSNKDVSGLLFSEQAMKKVATKLDAIPKVLDVMGKYKTYGASRALDSILGEREKKKPDSAQTRVKKLEEYNNNISKWVGNPDLTINRVAELTSNISTKGAPFIGSSLNNKMTNAMQYLASQLPKPPRPNSPFGPQYQYRPSDHDMAAFEQKLQVVHDPFVVLRELAHGTLTKNHMDALDSVYPGIARMVRERVVQSAVSNPVKMDYSKRLKLSLILGTPLDESVSPGSVQYYQQTYAGPDQGAQAEAEASAGTGMDQNGFKAQVNMSKPMLTDTQRVQVKTS